MSSGKILKKKSAQTDKLIVLCSKRQKVAECMEIQAEIMRDSMPEDALYFNPWTGFQEKAIKDLPLKQKELTQVL